jgi:hypothetical protein
MCSTVTHPFRPQARQNRGSNLPCGLAVLLLRRFQVAVDEHFQPFSPIFGSFDESYTSSNSMTIQSSALCFTTEHLPRTLLSAVTLKAAPEVLHLSGHDFYFGYSMWPDLATRCFQGFLLYDGVTMAHYMGIARVTTVQILVHHVLFLLIAFYCTSGSYFKYVPWPH